MGAKRGSKILITKRREQLTRQLVMQMLDKKDHGKDAPGLLTKLMEKLEKDLDSTDEELRHKSMDKIIKLLPFVIAKEKSPAIQLNVQNNVVGPQITAGKSTVLAVDTIQTYLKNREKRMKALSRPPIEDAEIIEVKDGNEKNQKQKANWIPPVEEGESVDEITEK